MGLIGLIFAGYWFNWDWTGFNEHIGPRVQQYQPTKTLWDWLQLLIVPLVLAIIAIVFQLANSRIERQLAKQRYDNDQQIAKQRYEQDQQIALDKQREDLLQTYLDRMSELLLKEGLRSSAVNAEVRNVARVRTITLLFQLDARRIGYVFAFLREAGLMSTTPNDSIVSLKNAHLENINFSQANLSRANLSGANLSEANLSEANLSGADLGEASLSEADLSRAYLGGANLSKADLSKTNLDGAYLGGANLGEADLSKADLSRANLSGAFLSEANLSRADLSETDLSGAVVTEEQLKETSSLEHATMPDGSEHR